MFSLEKPTFWLNKNTFAKSESVSVLATSVGMRSRQAICCAAAEQAGPAPHLLLPGIEPADTAKL